MKNKYRDDKPMTVSARFNGVDLDIYSPLEKDFLKLLITEITEEEIYKPPFPHGKVCIDLGANIGLASLYLKDYFDEVHAVEPVPLYYDALVKNTKDYKNIKTYKKAISAYNQDAYFYSPRGIVPQSFYGLQVDERFSKKKDFNSMKVESITLEKFMDDNKIDTVDYLKMDVEGAEYEIFFDESFERIAHRIKSIIGEAHVRKDGGGHPSSIPYILQDRGFEASWKRTSENNYWYMPQFTNRVTNVAKSVKVPMWTIFEAVKK